MTRILCIDGDRAANVALHGMLHGMGHEPVLAQTLSAARRALAQRPFELVLAELCLADGSGAELVAALREDGMDVPVIGMSPHENARDAERGARHGMEDHLSKPLRLEAVRIAVSKALEIRRLRRKQAAHERDMTKLRGVLETLRRGDHAGLHDLSAALDHVLTADRDATPRARSGRARTAPVIPAPPTPIEWSLDLSTLERQAIGLALEQTGGNRTRAARLLGITDRTLRNKLRTR